LIEVSYEKLEDKIIQENINEQIKIVNHNIE